MKVLLLCAEHDSSLFVRFKDFFSQLLIETSLYVVKDEWSLMEHKLLQKILKRADYYLVVPKLQSLNDSWLVFTLGTLKGQYERCLFYFHEEPQKLPPWLKNYRCFYSFQEMRLGFLEIFENWETKIAKTWAEMMLEEMDIERAAVNFIKAVQQGDRMVCGLFLEAGFSPEIRNENGVPLICLAARNGSLQLIKMLLLAGADINAVSEDRGNSPLMDCAASGFEDILDFLLEKEADLEIKSRNGQTALLLAVGNQRKNCSIKLIQAGADTSVRDKLGMSSLKYAELFHEDELLEMMGR